MENISCLNLASSPILGLCNQLYSLVAAITKASSNKKEILIVNNFLTEIWSNNYTPISSILDMYITNIFLKKYNVFLIDSNNINFKIKKVLFGINNKLVDITTYIIDNHYNKTENTLNIPKEIDLLSIKGDPCEYVEKKLYIYYQLNDNNFCSDYDEKNGSLINDVVLNFNNLEFTAVNEWKTDENQKEFNDVLRNLVFHSKFINYAKDFINTFNSKESNKINVIHLRIELDGIQWWAHQNHMESERFQSIVESKYILIIKKYINPKDNTIILCADEDNKVIDFLKNNGYNCYLHKKDKSIGRERNALTDLCIGENCNNIFIAPINCSSFSYTLKNRIKYPINTISFCLNRILDKLELDLPLETNKDYIEPVSKLESVLESVLELEPVSKLESESNTIKIEIKELDNE